MRGILMMLALAMIPASAHASDSPASWQWVALIAMITSLLTLPLYAISAAVFLRLIGRGKLASTRPAHAVPLAVFVAYVLVRLASGSIGDGVVAMGLFVGWLCASAPYTLLVQWYWDKTQAAGTPGEASP